MCGHVHRQSVNVNEIAVRRQCVFVLDHLRAQMAPPCRQENQALSTVSRLLLRALYYEEVDVTEATATRCIRQRSQLQRWCQCMKEQMSYKGCCRDRLTGTQREERRRDNDTEMVG